MKVVNGVNGRIGMNGVKVSTGRTAKAKGRTVQLTVEDSCRNDYSDGMTTGLFKPHRLMHSSFVTGWRHAVPAEYAA